jgi:hypothetical protein
MREIEPGSPLWASPAASTVDPEEHLRNRQIFLEGRKAMASCKLPAADGKKTG